MFKLTRKRIAPGESLTINRSHRFEHVTIRRIRPGRHVIDLQVNGRVIGATFVEVIDGT